MKLKEKLSKHDIYMLHALLAPKMTLLRVFPYESQVIMRLADTEGYSKVHIQKNSILYKRLVEIRKYADKFNINDNKIVIQVEVNVGWCKDMLFLGFWDHCYSIGEAVIPSKYAPKEFPTNGWTGMDIDFSTTITIQ